MAEGKFKVFSGQVLAVLNYDPAKDTDVLFRSASRSVLTMPDLVSTNTPDILVPVASFNGSNAKLSGSSKITGGGAWDLTIRFKLTNAASNNPLYSCGGYSGVVKGLGMRVNSNTLNIFTSNGTASVTSNFAFNFQSATWYTLRFQWSGVTGETMTCTVGATVLTAKTCNGWTGDSNDFPTIGCYGGSVFMAGLISSFVGTISQLAVEFYPNAISSKEFSVNSGLSYDWGGTKASIYESGSTWILDKGYSVYTNGTITYHVPNNSAGATIVISFGGGYYVSQFVAGSLTAHNLYDSKIRFKNAFFDRSNATIWGDLARGADYDSGNKKDFHISKLDLLTLRSWLNDGYRGMLYLKGDLPTVDDMTVLNEIFLKTTDVKTTDEEKILKYTLDIRRTQKDENGAYILDAQGYKQLYLYGDLGGDAVANFTKFQSLIDAGSSSTLSGNKYEVYAISQPLVMASNKSLTVNCELRPKKATIVNLTANVVIGDTVINVDSVAGFAVGEWVAISDNLLAVQGGSVQTRRVASSGKITEIGETTITLGTPSVYAVTAASGGKLGHQQSLIICKDITTATINGNGIINGDWTNQYDVEPVRQTGSEETLMGCGITLQNSDSVSIGGTLEVKNCILHGISVRGTAPLDYALNNSIGELNIHHNHDKNILALLTNGLVCNGTKADESLFEDGFSLYLSNINFTLNNISASGNLRSNLMFNSNAAANGVVNVFDSIDGGINIYSEDIELNDINISGASYLLINDILSMGDNIVINGITYDTVSATSLLQVLGGCTGIEINDLIIDGCTTSAAAILADDRAGNAAFPTVAITGGGISNHTGTKTSIDASATVTFTNFTGLP